MIQLLLKYRYFLAAGVVVVLLLILFQNKRKEKNQKKETYEKRVKDQILNEALKNNFGRRNAFKEADKAEPMESCMDLRKSDTEKRGSIVMKLSVVGDQTKSYVINPEKHVLIGRAEGLNDIVLNGENIARQHCDVFMYENRVYVKNLDSSYPMALSRKSSRTMVEKQEIRVMTGDIILIGGYKIHVTLTDYMGNIIAG